MKRIMVAATLMIVLLCLAGFAEGRLQFSFLPNANAAFASLASTHTFDLTFATLLVEWEASTWSPLGLSRVDQVTTGLVLNLAPTLSIPILFGNWECQINMTFHYRTSLFCPLDSPLLIIFRDSWSR